MDCLRNAMAKLYQANPIPAFMEGNYHPIVPTNYPRFLCGSLARVYFTVSQKFLRPKVPTSFFTTTLDELAVLQVHTPVDLSPSKARFAARFLINPPAEANCQHEKIDEPTASKPTKRQRIN
ncbi:hypothetical protein RhiJN_26319 [Ceratobasidium sp. AG-Ba]|nr:hypothetical protein RhiJN_26319 [Ceratobasidium sp. AG-Ba]